MSNRKHIPHAVELAAALLQLVDANGKRLIPHSHAKLMTADQIISLFARDHYPVRVADGGEDLPWNLTWRLRHEHKVKTAKVDQPELGKQRRIRARELKHQEIVSAKVTHTGRGYVNGGWTWKNRPFPKGRKFGAKRPIAF